eukprot:6176891-Pleurochrysis_carterae.AAC.1
MIIKSDNGTAFRNELTRAFAKYAGLRRAFVLPYNAPANGMAEQAVACIARLLVRHTQQFRNWPDTLPMVAFALNCTEHLSTARSWTETENEFVDVLATRLRQAWLALRDTSEIIRLDAAARADAHHRRRLKPITMDSAGGIQVEECVLLMHGSIEYAALLKKHGFPPLRSFRVLDVVPEYNALRVDTRTGYRHPTRR